MRLGGEGRRQKGERLWSPLQREREVRGREWESDREKEGRGGWLGVERGAVDVVSMPPSSQCWQSTAY